MIEGKLFLSSPGAPSEKAYAKFLAGDRLGFRDNAGPRSRLAVEPVFVHFAPYQAKRQPAPALRLPHAVQGRVSVESSNESAIVRAALAESHISAVAAITRADSAAPIEAAIAEGSDAGQGQRDTSRASVRQHGFQGDSG